ncbi:hypothetical protein HN670_01405 [bacterium]|jgi:hypothetical protein|nr:hypothetical protein [bacterium]
MNLEQPQSANSEAEEFDEICQFCKKPTGKKVEIPNSHGTCDACMPGYRQELEEWKADRAARQAETSKDKE